MEDAIMNMLRSRSLILDWIAEQVIAEFPESYWGIDPKALRSDLDLFLKGNDDKSAEELQEIAGRLSPGGAHTSGFLTGLVIGNLPFADPVLVAALLYHNWKGGKVFHRFLPSPHETPLDEYVQAVGDLELWLENVEPQQIVTNMHDPDLAFYNALPDSFTVYRGGMRCTPDAVAAGICWSTSKPVAEWFANRLANDDDEPILVSARIQKSWIRLAFASEFEVVVTPLRWRRIKCRRKSPHPVMEWKKEPDHVE